MNRTEPHRTEPHRTEPHRTEPHRTEPDGARIALTGSSGFVGSAVRRALIGAGPTADLRLLVHTPGPGVGPGSQVHRLDLEDPATLTGACAGVDVLVHCASSLGRGPQHSEAVDRLGTARLVEEARCAGVRRIVYVSSCAVYGRGRFVGVRPGDVPLAPVSVTSRARVAAEEHVLEAGGYVVRPHLVLGAGDRWVLPAVHRLRLALGAPVESRAHSMIAVDDLGRLVAGLARVPDLALDQHIYHAAGPEPVPSGVLFDAVEHWLSSSAKVVPAGVVSPGTLSPGAVPPGALSPQVLPSGALPPGASPSGTSPLALPVPVPVARGRLQELGLGTHDLDILGSESWFAADELWRITGLSPSGSIEQALASGESWYRRHLGPELRA